MKSRMRDGGRIASAWALSVVAHGSLIAVGALLVTGTFSARTQESTGVQTRYGRTEKTIEIELAVVVGDGIDRSLTLSRQPIAPSRGGGEAAPRPEIGFKGRGGTNTVEQPALNLADRDDGMSLTPEVHSRMDRSQIQRIQSARHRASREDWRASREPMELTFVASGRYGKRSERRALADADPSAGARDQGVFKRRGGLLGAKEAASGVGMTPLVAGSAVEGGAHASLGLGVRDGAAGDDHRASAEVALARPMVAEGTPSIPSSVQGRPNDTLDGEQEVASAMQSIVHASTAGGAAGRGRGGQEGPGATGSGGIWGSGSSARALGAGVGASVDSDPSDRRRSLYMRQVLAKIHPLWANAFPKQAALEGLQGTAIITFVINANGSVLSARISRPSGVPEFDENCRRAVLQGAPYAPLSPELGQSLRWSMPFEMKNPAVRPKQ